MARSSLPAPITLDPHGIAEAAGNPRPLTLAQVREWPDEYLSYAAVPGNQTPYNQQIVARELRRREAWAAPAGRAYWISIVAAVISIFALAVNAMGKF